MVSHLDERVSVACPLPQAALRLRDYFREHGNAAGDTLKLKLGVDVTVPGGETAIALKRAVIATVQSHHVAGDMTPRYRLQWAPEVAGPLPLFTGELLVSGTNDFDSFALELHGTYAPPLGFFGKGFDMAIGHRVALATASDLLGDIKRAIERAFTADEARKNE